MDNIFKFLQRIANEEYCTVEECMRYRGTDLIKLKSRHKHAEEEFYKNWELSERGKDILERYRLNTTLYDRLIENK